MADAKRKIQPVKRKPPLAKVRVMMRMKVKVAMGILEDPQLKLTHHHDIC
ncbi:uncharacterized protein G2W53_044155 [Senna tora]|uniref:Uncharacterized protein n=1 Tax=Senna tora TaxID=362788 RepID=A0A834SJU7_9FABA|nr:uncharacterized protein G2W53_044155 [Senna tora]